MREDDKKGVKVVATASDMGKSGGNNGDGEGRENKNERAKNLRRIFSTQILHRVSQV